MQFKFLYCGVKNNLHVLHKPSIFTASWPDHFEGSLTKTFQWFLSEHSCLSAYLLVNIVTYIRPNNTLKVGLMYVTIVNRQIHMKNQKYPPVMVKSDHGFHSMSNLSQA